MKLIFFVSLLLFINGCFPTSQNVRIDNPSVIEGNELLLIGEEFLRRNKIEEAEKYFNLAYERFNRVDYVKGKVNSLLKLAVISMLQNDISKKENYLYEAMSFKSYLTEQEQIIFLLTEVELLKIQKNDNAIIELIEKFPDYDIEIEIVVQFLVYRTQALLNKEMSTKDEINKLISLEKKVKKLYDEYSIDASIYSLLLETIAYYYYKQNELNVSLEYFEKAKFVNGYNEYYLGVANNLYYKALILEKLDNINEAILIFKSSYEIYLSLNETIKSEYSLFKYLELSLKAGDNSKLKELKLLYDKSQNTRLKEEITKIIK